MRCWARDRKVICHWCLTGLSKVWWCLELSVVRERPFDFQGGGGFQAGILFLHVFRDRILFSTP